MGKIKCVYFNLHVGYVPYYMDCVYYSILSLGVDKMTTLWNGEERRSNIERRREIRAIHKWRWRALALWIVLFTSVVIYALMYARESRHENCVRISNTIQNIIKSSDSSLGKPGTPGYAYYKTHPDELKQAHYANRNLITSLSPDKCN